MSLFRHLILTRFDVRIPEYPDAGGAEWLSHRFDIFERYCLPCVLSQTSQEFEWLLLCGLHTRPETVARLNSYAGLAKIRPVRLDGDFSQDTVRAAVVPFLADLRGSRGHLITTRLDNDDGISRTFVENIQERFCGQEFEFLNFSNGYIWENGRAWRGCHRTNAFISLVERCDNPRTIFSGNHMELRRLGAIRQIEGTPGWLQVVHGRNLSNQPWGEPVPVEDLYEHFDIKPADLEPGATGRRYNSASGK